MKKYFAFAFVATALMMASCEDEEQSSLDFGAIKGTATLQGQVTYTTTEYDKSGNVVNTAKIENAAGATVLVTVDNSEYANAAQGQKTYEATTNQDGKYTVEIPVGVKSISAKVEVKNYVGSYSQWTNNSLSTSEVEYYAYSTTVSLIDGQISNADLTLSQKNAATATATIQGQVTYTTTEYDKSTNVLNSSKKENAAGATVLVTTAYSNESYEATTDQEGMYTIKVPAGTYYVSIKKYVGSYSEWNNNSILTYNEVEFASSSSSVYATANQVSEANISLNVTKLPEVTERNQKVTIKGAVETIAEKADKEKSYTSYYYAPLSGMNIVVTVKNYNDNRILRYETTTNTNGEYEVPVTIFDNWNLSRTTVVVATSTQTGTLTHYYREYSSYYSSTYSWRSQKINIVYSEISTDQTLSELSTYIPVKIPTLQLSSSYFVLATDKSEIKGIGNDSDRDENGNTLIYNNDPLNLNYK